MTEPALKWKGKPYLFFGMGLITIAAVLSGFHLKPEYRRKKMHAYEDEVNELLDNSGIPSKW